MTRTKAIEILSCRDNRGLPITWQDGFVDAVDTAIEALSTDIVRCKDCVRHNVAVKDWYDDHEKKVCPLVEHRGKAQGHEFDYQFCCFGERKEQ